MLVNKRWLELWPGRYYVSLNPKTSNHSPLVLKGELQNPLVMLFRFDNYLASSLNFIPVVHSIWPNQVVGTSMYSVTRKLKAVKLLFKQQRHIITNYDEVVAKFIVFYEQLLGGTRNSRTLDLTQYRPWASRILSHEDGVRLTCPVSLEEIKLVFFDIAEDKSPRPDGYTAAFYKAACPIVGGEITRAIMEFFTNGRLLTGLELFATLSGLHVNLAKSQLILSKAARHDSTQFLATLGFQEGQLPVKYLEVQLISSRLSLANCRPLLDKINSRIQGWGRISLSFAARVQLIKSALMALNTYWAMAFILPKGIIKEIEKHLQNFLWKGVARTGYSKVTCSQVCNPIDEGGLGVRDFQSLNLALMSRRLWEVI
ncbi:UNVERIFIED_CONTAM: hypothetical protein Scaly_0609800 [Sesamum calycinum]|uniref:Reverse transcriptase n=1 Tax=Sesamum calycinum TaxID=2727403 RepID=A0AAW2RSJ0_9LAMI